MEPRPRYGQVARKLVVGLTDTQYEWVKEQSDQARIPMNEVVRNAIDETRRRTERKKA